MTHFIRTTGFVFAALIATTTHAQDLVRQPYVQGTSNSRAVVAWRTDVQGDSVVRYGSAPDALDQEVGDAAQVTQHEIEITGLSDRTRYYYSISTGDQLLAGGDEDHFFVTAPPPGTKQKHRMWVVGDSGTGSAKQLQVRDAMRSFTGKTPPDLFLHMGDMAYGDGTTDQFTGNFFSVYEEVLRNTVVWPTMGNHEGHSADPLTESGPYYDSYALPRGGEAGGVASGTEAYYSFDYANVHFIVLESHQSDRTVTGPMLMWLQQDLQATDQDWLIAYWHHPAYTKGSHDSDAETNLIEMRENAVPMLEAAGVDLVLAGHSHIYERSWLLDGAYDTPTIDIASILDTGDGRVLGDGPYSKQAGSVPNDGAVYIVAGHGGTATAQDGAHPLMFFAESENGSCLVDVQDNRLGVANLRWDGVVTDTFTIVKGAGVVVGAPDGGERLRPGADVDVRWTSLNSSGDVRIEYSSDAGTSWEAVADTADTGSYGWTLPDIDSDEMLIRVSSIDNPQLSDESNGTFIISSEIAGATIPFGATWKYHDSGVDLGNDWLSIEFDDSDWAEGAGKFGFGHGDEATTIDGSDPARPSYYFRKIIRLAELPTTAAMRLIADDGAAVWINGLRVFEKNVEEGVAYVAPATSVAGDDDISAAELNLNPFPFFEGDNIITVVVKNHPDDGDDLAFDLELSLDVPLAGAESAPPPPDSDDSCSCRMVGQPRSAAAGYGLLGLGMLLLGRRRRRADQRE